MFTPVTKAAKRAIGLASTTQTNIIAHPGIVELITLMQNQIQHHFTELVIRLNDGTLAQLTSEIRLRQLQLASRSVMPIWYLRDEIRSALNTKNNLNGSIIQRMSNMGFAFDGNHNIANEWDIPGCGPDLLNVIFDLQTSLSAIDFQKTLRSLWSGKIGRAHV